MELQCAAERFRIDGTSDPILKGVPAVFTRMIETGAPNLYEDDVFVLYLNKGLPYPELDDNAGMAFVHMLACPKERIYNAATLRPSDKRLLEYMRDSVRNLVDMPEFREKVIFHQKLPSLNLVKLDFLRFEGECMRIGGFEQIDSAERVEFIAL